MMDIITMKEIILKVQDLAHHTIIIFMIGKLIMIGKLEEYLAQAIY